MRSVITPLAIGLLIALSGTAFSADKAADSDSSTQGKQSMSEADRQFEAVSHALIPLTVKQIGTLKHRSQVNNEAVNQQPVAMRRVTDAVSLEPGAAFPVMVLTPGYVSSIRFVDSMGEPWAVTSQSVGNTSWFSITKPEGLTPGNLLVLSALSPKAHSNAIVTLEGLNETISIVIKTGDLTSAKPISSVTYQLPGLSPTTQTPTFSSPLPSTVDNLMMDVLSNIIPVDAQQVSLDSTAAKAWTIDGSLYVRTRKTLVWPAFEEFATSGGVNVYKISAVSRLLITDLVSGTTSVGVDL